MRAALLVAVETSELLQWRLGLVSARWGRHRHRGRFHGAHPWPRKSVIVHVSWPPGTNPNRCAVHRRSSARYLTLENQKLIFSLISFGFKTKFDIENSDSTNYLGNYVVNCVGNGDSKQLIIQRRFRRR